MESKFTIVPLK